MNILSKITHPEYCEGSPLLFLSEPLNFFSNIFFFLSAWAIYKLVQKHKMTSWEYFVFPRLMFVLGVMSSLWHSWRNTATLILDAAPVFLFLGLVFYVLLKVLTKKQVWAAWGTISFIIFEILVSILVPENYLNGSLRHVVVISLLLLTAIWVYWKYPSVAKDGFLALGIFILAVVMRTIDPLVCEWLPIGTHFLWHTSNPLGAYVGVRFLIKLESKSS